MGLLRLRALVCSSFFLITFPKCIFQGIMGHTVAFSLHSGDFHSLCVMTFVHELQFRLVKDPVQVHREVFVLVFSLSKKDFCTLKAQTFSVSLEINMTLKWVSHQLILVQYLHLCI